MTRNKKKELSKLLDFHFSYVFIYLFIYLFRAGNPVKANDPLFQRARLHNHSQARLPEKNHELLK